MGQELVLQSRRKKWFPSLIPRALGVVVEKQKKETKTNGKSGFDFGF